MYYNTQDVRSTRLDVNQNRPASSQSVALWPHLDRYLHQAKPALLECPVEFDLTSSVPINELHMNLTFTEFIADGQ